MCIYFFSVGCLWELYICIRLVSFRSLFIEAIVDGAETITHGTNCRRQKQNKIKSIVKFKTTWWRTGIVTSSTAEWERRRTKKTILRPTTLTKIDWRTFDIATSKSFCFFFGQENSQRTLVINLCDIVVLVSPIAPLAFYPLLERCKLFKIYNQSMPRRTWTWKCLPTLRFAGHICLEDSESLHNQTFAAPLSSKPITE